MSRVSKIALAAALLAGLIGSADAAPNGGWVATQVELNEAIKDGYEIKAVIVPPDDGVMERIYLQKGKSVMLCDEYRATSNCYQLSTH
jgi:predicted deacylase